MLRFFSFLVLALIVAAGMFAYSMQTYIHSPAGDVATEIEVVVEPGASFNNVLSELSEVNLISKPIYFKLLAMYLEKTQSIQSGEYKFAFSQTPAEILQDLVSGNTIRYSFTVIEGKTISDFLRKLQEHPKIERTIQDDDDVKKQLQIERNSLEGLFLPETFHFVAGTKDIEILRQSYTLLRKLLDEQWPKRSADSFVSSPYEALILASIVEKETAVADERARIAGVYISRLKRHMRLQADPTVIYGLGENFDGNLTRKHLETDSPYNTYTRFGLPPTPIALPSREAIIAVLQPEMTGELYFVAKGDGSHHFSKTYEEHNEAVRTFQLKKKK